MDIGEIQKKYNKITQLLIAKNMEITTMESCTSGLIATLLTNVENSSRILKGAFVTYSNQAKIMQGVNENVIKENGVYSFETALSMAKACMQAYDADIGIGITGVFGNIDPNNKEGRVGTVFIAITHPLYEHQIKIEIPENLNRFQSKLYVANEIAEQLMMMLEA